MDQGLLGTTQVLKVPIRGDSQANPHISQELLHCGNRLGPGVTAVIAVHGRGQSGQYMVDHVVQPLMNSDVAWLIPQAHENSWYPTGFQAPLTENQPRLNHALEALDLVALYLASVGVPTTKTIWLGFSQGACLVTEWMARHPCKWGGLVSLTGARIGPPGIVTTIEGDYGRMPAYFGIGLRDEWVPHKRSRETAAQFRSAGATVEMEVFDDSRHEIRSREILAIRRIVDIA
jgi:phospholipase/carboxylesterase